MVDLGERKGANENDSTESDELLSIVREMGAWRSRKIAEYNTYSSRRLIDEDAARIQWRNLFDEVFARAFLKDEHCTVEACPVRPNEINNALVRFVNAYGSRIPPFGADCERAFDVMRRLYEVYMKALQVVGSLIDVIDEEPPRDDRNPDSLSARIAGFEDGRFGALLLKPVARLMRNAIAHETVYQERAGGEISFQSKDETVKLTYDEANSILTELHQRVLAFFEAKQVFEMYSTKTIEVGMTSASEERRRIFKEMVRSGYTILTRDGEVVPLTTVD